MMPMPYHPGDRQSWNKSNTLILTPGKVRKKHTNLTPKKKKRK